MASRDSARVGQRFSTGGKAVKAVIASIEARKIARGKSRKTASAWAPLLERNIGQRFTLPLSFSQVTASGERKAMARKTVFVSDLSGKTIEEGKAAKIRVSFEDARRGSYEIDATAEEAAELGRKGRQVARRGRKPKAAS
jgi:hypothetical protein